MATQVQEPTITLNAPDPVPIMIPFSVLDLAPIRQGGDAAQAFRNSLDLAQHAEIARALFRRNHIGNHGIRGRVRRGG